MPSGGKSYPLPQNQKGGNKNGSKKMPKKMRKKIPKNPMKKGYA